MTTASRYCIFAGALLLGTMASGASAQKTTPCNRIGTTAFTFWRTGGNIKPEKIELLSDGLVTVVDEAADPPASRLHNRSPEAVAGLARLAWTGGFARLRSGPARPTANRDAALQVIDVRSMCGRHRVEWKGDGAPPEFTELWALLVIVSDAVP